MNHEHQRKATAPSQWIWAAAVEIRSAARLDRNSGEPGERVEAESMIDNRSASKLFYINISAHPLTLPLACLAKVTPAIFHADRGQRGREASGKAEERGCYRLANSFTGLSQGQSREVSFPTLSGVLGLTTPTNLIKLGPALCSLFLTQSLFGFCRLFKLDFSWLSRAAKVRRRVPTAFSSLRQIKLDRNRGDEHPHHSFCPGE